MDRPITASDANQRFSEMLREVTRGERFVVTSRGRPVARITPVDGEGDQAAAVASLLAFLETRPARRLDGWTRDDLYA
ncbi:hypothetical protein IP88_15215 [alpha proteobacterium AAP81b]|nr:hypothetical protein IP88_15215 [alpha proteobacterium AAP81b]